MAQILIGGLIILPDFLREGGQGKDAVLLFTDGSRPPTPFPAGRKGRFSDGEIAHIHIGVHAVFRKEDLHKFPGVPLVAAAADGCGMEQAGGGFASPCSVPRSGRRLPAPPGRSPDLRRNRASDPRTRRLTWFFVYPERNIPDGRSKPAPVRT